jgi:hypothetical protein
MKTQNYLLFACVIFGCFLLLFSGCAPGNPQYQDHPPGFWHGLWHGMISSITFVISLFKDSVRIYQANNTGGWYDFGFLMGVTCIWGGGLSGLSWKSAEKQQREEEWKEIGLKLEQKIMSELKNWVEENTGTQDEEIANILEQKLRHHLHQWLEQESQNKSKS